MKRVCLVAILLLAALLPVYGCGDDTAADQNVIAAAGKKLNDAGTYQSDFDMQVFVDASGPAVEEFQDIIPLELSMQGSAEIDVSDLEKPKERVYGLSVDGTRDIFMLMMEQQGEPAAAGHIVDGMMKQIIKDVEMLVYENDIYYYFGNQWYELSMEDLADLPGSGSGAPDMECLMDLSAGSMDYSDYSQRVNDILVEITDEGGEDVDGTATTRYTAAVDAARAQEFFQDYMGTYIKQMGECGVTDIPTDDELDEVMGVLDETMATLADKITIEVWIDEKGYPRQQRYTIELDDEDMRQILAASDGSGVDSFNEDISMLDARIEITLKNSRIGEDIAIERPEDAIPFTQLFEDLDKTFSGDSSTEAWNG